MPYRPGKRWRYNTKPQLRHETRKKRAQLRQQGLQLKTTCRECGEEFLPSDTEKVARNIPFPDRQDLEDISRLCPRCFAKKKGIKASAMVALSFLVHGGRKVLAAELLPTRSWFALVEQDGKLWYEELIGARQGLVVTWIRQQATIPEGMDPGEALVSRKYKLMPGTDETHELDIDAHAQQLRSLRNQFKKAKVRV